MIMAVSLRILGGIEERCVGDVRSFFVLRQAPKLRLPAVVKIHCSRELAGVPPRTSRGFHLVIIAGLIHRPKVNQHT